MEQTRPIVPQMPPQKSGEAPPAKIEIDLLLHPPSQRWVQQYSGHDSETMSETLQVLAVWAQTWHVGDNYLVDNTQ